MLVFKSQKIEDFYCYLLKFAYNDGPNHFVLLADCKDGCMHERTLDGFIKEYVFMGEKSISLDAPTVLFKTDGK